MLEIIQWFDAMWKLVGLALVLWTVFCGVSKIIRAVRGDPW